MITVVDYGAGNLFSVRNALEAIGESCVVTGNPEEIRAATALILPGVGHLGQMIVALDSRGLRDPLIEIAGSGVPFLGICLGMQALFEGSDEAPRAQALGILPGTAQRFPADRRSPHMGWNRATFAEGNTDWFYFANSYALPIGEFTWAVTDYFGDFTSAVRRENIWGFQFHPEKSGGVGLALLGEWCALGR